MEANVGKIDVETSIFCSDECVTAGDDNEIDKNGADVAGSKPLLEYDENEPMKAIQKCNTTSSNSLPWFLIKEETLGFLCNLASSLYNYHGSRITWPHWETKFRAVDRLMGWTGGDGEYVEVLNEDIYTLDMEPHVPLYVPRAMGSTFGAYLFWFLWTVIPVIYVSYFLAMYCLAERSPGVKVQRALLLFAMFHFLFMTGTSCCCGCTRPIEQ